MIRAEAISKLYPSRPVTIFPPVRSIFERSRDEVRTDSFVADYDIDIDDDEDEDALEGAAGPPSPTGPDETFWALRDISLSVAPHGAVGIVGGPEAGKSTLLRILAGRAFPTEGRVLVRGRVAPLAADVERALGLSAKATGHDIVLASRLVGVDARRARQHREEIEELAQPLVTADGDPAPGARQRLAVATTLVLPSDLILLDDLRRLDDAFVGRVGNKLRQRLDEGAALVLASRDRLLADHLCGEVMLLTAGAIEDRAGSAGDEGRRTGKRRRAALVLAGEQPSPGAETQSNARRVAPFNASAALVSAEVRTATGVPSKNFGANDELTFRIRLETAAPDTVVRCGVCLSPRTGPHGFRLELPEPARIARPRVYLVMARVAPGSLPSTGFKVRVDARVAGPAETGTSVIARGVSRFRIDGDDLDFVEPREPPVVCWDGESRWLVEADWSVVEERSGR